MHGKPLKTMKHYVKNGEFWAGTGNKNMTFMRGVIFPLKYCNLILFIVYMPVSQDIFI